MVYRVHLRSRGDVNFRCKATLDPNCWLTNKPEIVFESRSLDQAEMVAYSYVGRDPLETAYVSHEDGRLIGTYRCTAADDERTRLSGRVAYLFGLTLLCSAAFLFAAIFGRAGLAFLVFLLAVLLYTTSLILKILNHTEGLCVSLAVELLCLFLVRTRDWNPGAD